jgi:hypothetical protein
MNLLQLKGIQTLKDNAWHTLKRFPIVLFTAIVGTVAALILVDSGLDDDSEFYKVLIRLLVGSSLGLSATLAAYLFGESHNWAAGKRHALAGGVLGLVAVYATLWFSPYPGVGDEILYRHFLFLLIAHLLVSVIAFTGAGSVSGFWKFNSKLFTSILLAGLYTGTLWVGISLGLLGVDNLLGIDVNSKVYGRMFIFLAGVFNTWFFLSHVPQLSEVETEDDSYPAELKVFTSFVLLPLNALYAVILYLYMFKIAVQGSLPEGYVTWLVQWFSVAGILALLLIWPLRNREGQRWIQLYSKWFYRLLLPLVVLQFVAIGIRVAEYGLTIDRYFVIQLAVWLLAMALYFLFSKRKDIRIVPLSLAFVALYSSFGPWGAFSASERSQQQRLRVIGEKYKFIQEGVFVKTSQKPTKDDAATAESILNYLAQHHGVSAVEVFLKDPEAYRKEINSGSSRRYSRYGMQPYLERTYGYSWLSSGYEDYERHPDYTAFCNELNPENGTPFRLFGEEYLMQVNFNIEQGSGQNAVSIRQKLTHRTLEVNLDRDSLRLLFQMENRRPIRISLAPLVDSLLARSDITQDSHTRTINFSADEMTVKGAVSGLRVRLLIESLTIESDKDGTEVASGEAEAPRKGYRISRLKGLLLLADGA